MEVNVADQALALKLIEELNIDPGGLVVSRDDLFSLVEAAVERGRRIATAGLTNQRCCRVCGCTDTAACHGGCSWVGPSLCSACEPFVEQVTP